MVRFLPVAYSRVLEIGCADGEFRQNLTGEHEYWGVEPVRSAANTASKRLDNVLVGTYAEVEGDIPNDYFDLVICNDVIEHMVDHDKFLGAIKHKLSHGGCIVASIPNVRYVTNLFGLLVQKDWKYEESGIRDRTHMRYFTRKSQVRTFVENGYSISMVEGVNPYHGRTLTRRLACSLAVLVFGGDVKFLQFGIRAIENSPPNRLPLPAIKHD